MQKKRNAWLILAVGVLALPGLAVAQTKPSTERSTPFTSALRESWTQIDTNADDLISKEEIEVALKNPEIKGDAAAVVGSLKLVTRSKEDAAPKLTKSYFEEYNAQAKGQKRENGEAAADATTDPDRQPGGNPATRESGVNWDRYFSAGKARIARFSGSKHWTPTNFLLENCKQGPLGDCFFVASVSSMAWRDPERLAKLVVEQPDGSYEARFPGVEVFKFPALTDSQLAISGTTSGGGAWLAVMEQAFGRYRSRVRGGSTDVEGTDILRRGGDSAPTIQALTGNKTKRISFPKTAEERQAQESKYLEDLRKEITSAISEKRLITIGMQPPKTAPTVSVKNPDGSETKKPAGTLPKIPKGIVTNHVYMLVAYDPATDTVEVWNPHGNTFKPKGEPGLTNGFVTEKGRFKLTLAQAYSFYTSMTFEQSQSITKADAK